MKYSNKLRTISVIAASLAAISIPAWALDLQQGRAQGLVGEKPDGYIAAINSTGEVNKLVSEVNARRLQEYQKISKENGQPVDVVARLAAEKIIEKLPSGSMYQGSDGSWKKR